MGVNSQLFKVKSIDKLLADADAPEHRLKKSLGPWSLTALGIGAIIGSGIFVLTGTAAAGEYFQAPSILHAQVLDLISNYLRHGGSAGVLMHGRPPAGPAIAVSFLLVAIACSFAGLCYAELASMIPIAGSAYTYSYATLGEIFAWIIGWDLILEYAVSNVAVAVGFSGYAKAQLAAFGLEFAGEMVQPGVGLGAVDGRLLQRSGISDRVRFDFVAGPRSARIGGSEQCDGGHKDRRDPYISGRGRNARHILPTGNRLRPPVSPESSPAARSFSSPTSDSIRSPLRRRNAAIRRGICLSGSSPP